MLAPLASFPFRVLWVGSGLSLGAGYHRDVRFLRSLLLRFPIVGLPMSWPPRTPVLHRSLAMRTLTIGVSCFGQVHLFVISVKP